MKFTNMRMTKTLPIAFVSLALVVTLLTSVLGYRDFRASLSSQFEQRLSILANERSLAVENWFESLDSAIRNIGKEPSVVQALQGFSSTFGLLMEDPTADLQRAYITENPNPIGEKDLLDQAEGQIPYHYQHANFHPIFRDLKNRLDLYDFFIFDLDGNLIYSVYKEADYATNFETGPYSDSGLGIAYRAAKDLAPGETFFSDFAPYAPSADAPAAFLSVPIQDAKGAVVGVAAIQVPSGLLNNIVGHPEGLGETGQMTIFGRDLQARSNSRFEDGHQALDLLSPAEPILGAFDTDETLVARATSLRGDPAITVAHRINILGNTWVVLGEMSLSEVYADATAQGIKTLIIATIAMMAVGFCGWLVSQTFTKPLNLVVAAMAKIGERNYDFELPSTDRGDELGDLSRAVSSVATRLKEFDSKIELEQQNAEAQEFAVEELGSGLKKLAAGDFSQTLNRKFAAEYDPLRIDYNETVTRLGETIAKLKEFSKLIDDQTRAIGDDSQELSRRTENQAATLEETAAAIDQITESVRQSSDELQSAEKLVLEADGQAKQGRVVAEDTTKAMDEIEKSSEEISSIIRVVDDIAFQTNLLALNAGVEAARAGDAGRGFAVVAAEVRQLAMRSADAVAQIKTLIETSATNVGSGVKLVRDTEAVLLDIVQKMGGISSLISSVASGSTEQSGNIEEINIGVNNLDRVTQQNAAMVDNSNASVQALNAEAANLVELLQAFKVDSAGNWQTDMTPMARSA